MPACSLQLEQRPQKRQSSVKLTARMLASFHRFWIDSGPIAPKVCLSQFRGERCIGKLHRASKEHETVPFWFVADSASASTLQASVCPIAPRGI